MRTARLAVVLVVLVGATSCEEQAGIPATPQSTGSPTTTKAAEIEAPPQTRRAKAPEVEPRVTSGPDAGDWWERPCDLLTDDEAEHIGVDGEAETVLAGDALAHCRRSGKTRLDMEVHASFSSFEEPYIDERDWRYYAEATVQGQPAGVFSEESEPERECVVAVGLNPKASVHVFLTTDGDPDVCDRALTVASAMVQKIATG
ncbi:DUF3558 family protein [Actinokineospora soli]|uniref:DUF3558 family protein n=1 Tax=Actinokineospora soli TaxID=1048753 RepID=A0ABW2TR70_9PSEU